jgi:DNA-binding transcriptional ArsR family regulator
MQELSKVFKALSDRNRLEIFILLLRRTLCVKALVNCFDISQHLRVLREAGLVNGKKEDIGCAIRPTKRK